MKPQINLRLPEDLKKAAEKYAKSHNYRNLQELATDAIREKVAGKDYDESFTKNEIEMVDRLIDATIKGGELIGKDKLFKGVK